MLLNPKCFVNTQLILLNISHGQHLSETHLHVFLGPFSQTSSFVYSRTIYQIVSGRSLTLYYQELYGSAPVQIHQGIL